MKIFCEHIAEQLEKIAEVIHEIKVLRIEFIVDKNCNEIPANLTLAIRHLEDAQSRLQRGWSQIKE